LEAWHFWKTCKWPKNKHMKKKTSIGGLCSLSDQKEKLRTTNQPQQSWEICKWLKSKHKQKEYNQKVISHHKSLACELEQTTKTKKSKNLWKDMEMKTKQKNLTYLLKHTEFCWMHLEKLVQGTWNKNFQNFSPLEVLRSSKKCCSLSTIPIKTLNFSKHTSTH
jgi:hypothetical protein